MSFHPDSLPSLSGKVYIVTGGTSGIGFYTAARLAQHEAHVYLCARSIAKGEDAISRIKDLYPEARVELLEMEHLSLSSVVAAAKKFLSQETELHGLVNNAGIMATPFKMTEDGYEAQWQTNYLAHWVFTSHLLPVMLNTSKGLPPGSVRIVNVSSSGHYYAPECGINFDDTSLPQAKTMNRYGQSKLANILHAVTINTLNGPDSQSAQTGKGEIWTATVHPGLVESGLSSHAETPLPLKMVIRVYSAMGGRVDGDKGSWTNLLCVASPDFKKEQSGTYFQRIAKPGWQSNLAKDALLAEKLEKWTMEKMKGKWVE